MRAHAVSSLLIGLVLAGCAERGTIEPAARIQPSPTAVELSEATSAERERARAGARLELSRRLRERSRYHLLVAHGIGSAEALASMDAAIARMHARIEALQEPHPASDAQDSAAGCDADPAPSTGRTGRPAAAGCDGVLALCLRSDRCR
ncbi:hypothetical protein SVA_3783 [Sulfurifustis variabilis]|uniref:Lipoprotein n=1 Tax=Sulfurifustis variabilis TaxID=1675686 RepID=A0A1B4VH09_9GAMM|nr:hypothetical protein [Sulfurifustis variabilis]BAU50317.1 hypothetical protein SVA_3783 [Sulfurifustis variabilis]